MFNFKLYSLLESILNVNPQFSKIISNLKDNDTIASNLSAIISTDIKTNLNYLKPSDNNQDILFVNDTQVQRIIDKGENPFNKAVNRTKIGRAVQQILKDNQFDVNPADIEKFTNNYKNMYDQVVLGKFPDSDIEIVSGGMISFWYDENNYTQGGGTLNNSCMRYDECQDYFEIYENNPEVCQMIILKDKDKKLAGRALLWNLNDGKFYLDRIYTRYDHQVDQIYNYFKKLHPEGTSYHMENYGVISVNLKKYQYKLYPYMDSFYFLGYEDGLLSNEEGLFRDKIYFKLRSTEGEPTVYGGVWSERLDKYINSQVAVDINGNDDYVTQDMCEWSEYEDAYVYMDDVIQTERWGILNQNKCVRLKKDGQDIWVPEDLVIEVYVNGEFKQEIQDDFDTNGYIQAYYRTNHYNGRKVWGKEEDCIILVSDNFKKYIKNSYFDSLIKEEKILQLIIINQNIKFLLDENPHLPVVGGKRESTSYIPTQFNFFQIEGESSKNYIDSEYFYDTIFVDRSIIVTDVLSDYPESFHPELMKIHQYLLSESGSYNQMTLSRDFTTDLNQAAKRVNAWLEASEIKDDLFSISQLTPENNWMNKIPTGLGKEFDESQYQQLKEIYQSQYKIRDDNDFDKKFQSEILPLYLEAWQKLVFYMYLTRSNNRDGYLDHLYNQKIIKSEDRRILLLLSYDEFEIGRVLFHNQSFLNRNVIPRELHPVLRGLSFEVIDHLFGLYIKKEGF